MRFLPAGVSIYSIPLALYSFNMLALNESLEGSRLLREKVTVEGIRLHQKAFQEIADKNRGTRRAGSGGYTDSVNYVSERMKNAGFQVRLQEFPMLLSEDLSPPELKILSPLEYTFKALVDFASMSSQGKASIDAEVEAIDLATPSREPNHSSSGCEATDFAKFKRGNIALIQRGKCSFEEKAKNAIKAGASGVIIFNDGNSERNEHLSTRLNLSAEIPIIGASFETGNRLRGQVLSGPTGIKLHMKVDSKSETLQCQNVIAESAAGDSDRVVVVGAHLDSVRSGPGINDNGSGSATILSIAEKYAELGLVPTNKLRFIWFGAEELGLVGSEYYVNSLTTTEKTQILGMLNFDMLGSSNYVRFVYDGDSSPRNPAGSGFIEKIFLDFFGAQSLVTHPTAFNGRSDYGPFIGAGIPAGGLFSGAEGIKSSRLAQIYGGQAGEPFDPCYHRSCDNFTNTGETPETALALKSIAELSVAAAHAVHFLSQTKDNIRLPQSEEPAVPKPEFDYKGPVLIR